jgi:hypothetical protein
MCEKVEMGIAQFELLPALRKCPRQKEKRLPCKDKSMVDEEERPKRMKEDEETYGAK